MKNQRTGFIVPFLLVIIILLLIVMGGMYVYKNKPADQVPVTTSSSTSTTNTDQQASTPVPAKSIYKPTVSPSPYLTSKTWFWGSTLSLADGFLTEPADQSKFKLTFSNNGTFSASTDCNSIGGEYKITGNKIKLDKMMSTEMYCAKSREAEYRKMLEQAESFDFDPDDGALFLMLKDNRRMLYTPS